MAKKSIIDIEINDEKFRAFTEAFEEYEKKVTESNEAWSKLDGAMEAISGKMRKTVDSAEMTASGLDKAVRAQKELSTQTRQSHTAMERLASSSKKVASFLAGIGRFLFKMGGIGLGGGIMGLFGLDRLADAAMNRQRESRGMGMTTGGPSAFRTNMQRYVDVNALLSSSSILPYSVRQRIGAIQMGMDPDRLMRESNTQRALDIINQARKNWLRDRSNPLAASLPSTTGAGAFGLDLNTLIRLGNTPKAELMHRESRIFQDSQAMRITNKTANELSKLSIQLKRTGLVIETNLMQAAAKIAPQITKFTKEMTDEFVKLLQSGDLKMWLLRLGQAVKYAAEGIIWIGDKFSAFSHPVSKTKEAAKDIGWWVNGRLFGSDAVKAYPPSAEEKRKMAIPSKPSESAPSPQTHKLVKALTKHAQSQINPKPHKITVEAPAGSKVSDSLNSLRY